MSTFKPLNIDHVVIRVTDLKRSIDFYTRILGLDINKRRDDVGMIHLGAGSSLIDLVDIHGTIGKQGGGEPARDHANMDHVCLRIEPFDPAIIRSYLQRAGVDATPAMTRYGAQGNGLSIYCHDPDGNQIELKGPPEN